MSYFRDATATKHQTRDAEPGGGKVLIACFPGYNVYLVSANPYKVEVVQGEDTPQAPFALGQTGPRIPGGGGATAEMTPAKLQLINQDARKNWGRRRA